MILVAKINPHGKKLINNIGKQNGLNDNLFIKSSKAESYLKNKTWVESGYGKIYLEAISKI